MAGNEKQGLRGVPAPQAVPREVHIFDFPAEFHGEAKTVGMVLLTANEELQASARSRGDSFRLAYELAKASLYEVDGRRVGVEDGSVDEAWTKFSPKVRQLLLSAYSDMHTVDEKQVVAPFLKTRRVKVG